MRNNHNRHCLRACYEYKRASKNTARSRCGYWRGVQDMLQKNRNPASAKITKLTKRSRSATAFLFYTVF